MGEGVSPRGEIMSTTVIENHLSDMMKCIQKQTKKVQLLKNHIDIKRADIQLEAEENTFQHWLEGEGAYIQEHIPGQFLEDISRLHEAWHDTYAKVFDLYFGEKRFLLGERTQPKHLDEQGQTRVKIYYDELFETSEILMHKLDILKQRVHSSSALDDNDITTEEKLVI